MPQFWDYRIKNCYYNKSRRSGYRSNTVSFYLLSQNTTGKYGHSKTRTSQKNSLRNYCILGDVRVAGCFPSFRRHKEHYKHFFKYKNIMQQLLERNTSLRNGTFSYQLTKTTESVNVQVEASDMKSTDCGGGGERIRVRITSSCRLVLHAYE